MTSTSDPEPTPPVILSAEELAERVAALHPYEQRLINQIIRADSNNRLSRRAKSLADLTDEQRRRLFLSTEVRVRGVSNDPNRWEFRSRSNKLIPVSAFSFHGSADGSLQLDLSLSEIALEGSLIARIFLPDAETEDELLGQVRRLAAELGYGLYALEDVADEDLG